MADQQHTKPARRNNQEWLKERRESFERKAAQTPQELFLPGMDIGAMPSHLNRSSIFAPIARGRRKFHRQTAMVTRSDCVLEYTGEQLDEADAELVMALIWFARSAAIGVAVPLNRSELLKKLGRDTGKQQYEWLHRRIKSLTEATMFLEAKKPDGSTRYSIGKTVSFRIVDKFIYDDENASYSYVMDARWVHLFSNREYALLDWGKRMAIGRGQDMAKTLQRLVATSSTTVQSYSIEWLKLKMEYEGRLRDFKEALQRSITELKRVGIIESGQIELSTKSNEQLTMLLPKS